MCQIFSSPRLETFSTPSKSATECTLFQGADSVKSVRKSGTTVGEPWVLSRDSRAASSRLRGRGGGGWVDLPDEYTCKKVKTKGEENIWGGGAEMVMELRQNIVI